MIMIDPNKLLGGSLLQCMPNICHTFPCNFDLVPAAEIEAADHLAIFIIQRNLIHIITSFGIHRDDRGIGVADIADEPILVYSLNQIRLIAHQVLQDRVSISLSVGIHRITRSMLLRRTFSTPYWSRKVTNRNW